MGCPRSTTERSSTRSATRCERSNERTVCVGARIDAGPTISFAFNLGKIPDQGEDSDPILRDGPDLGLVAVFDGMGGAGGTVYETPDGRVPAPIWRPGSPGTLSNVGCWTCSNRTGT